MKQSRMLSPMALAVILAIGCGGGKPQDASADPAEAAGGGGSASIRGAVTFEGDAPAPQKVKMDADPVCQQQHAQPMYTEDAVVNPNGTLKNVFVYVKEGAKGPFPPATAPATLTQAGCWYVPHVLGLQVDQPLDIINGDATLHNVNAKPSANAPFNIAQPVKGMKTTKKFSKPEVMVKFKCNGLPWLSAYAGVVEHPFFGVSGEDGAFAITGLPAGTYVLEAWHEQYGTQTQIVSVADGETKRVEFVFTAP